MELIQKIAELEKRFPISKIGNDVFSARLIMEGLSEGGLRFLSRTPTGIYFEATMPQSWTPHLDGIDLETHHIGKREKSTKH